MSYFHNKDVFNFLDAHYVTDGGHPKALEINKRIDSWFYSEGFEFKLDWTPEDAAIEAFRRDTQMRMELEENYHGTVETIDIVQFLNGFPIEHSWRMDEILVPVVIEAMEILYAMRTIVHNQQLLDNA